MDDSTTGLRSDSSHKSINRVQDLEYLAELLADFGVDGHPEPAEAQSLIFSRYQLLQNNIPRFLEVLAKHLEHGGTLPGYLKLLTFSVHEFLYDGILRNAGKTRQISDPNGGLVRFGGIHRFDHRAQFQGVAAADIDTKIEDAFSYLSDEDPIRGSGLFYVHFAKVHPFYDANGRIARFLVSLYLQHKQLYIHWDRIDQRHGEFIKKINGVLKRMSGFRKGIYEGYFLRFWSKHIEPLSAFMDPQDLES